MTVRTVAVTGATGFIGRHMVPALAARGWRVRLLVRRMSPLPTWGAIPLEIELGDLDDAGACARLVRGADAVVHLAGLVKALDRAAFFTVNAEASRRLCEAVAAAGGSPLTVVLLSSLAARRPDLSDYAASKRAGEAAVAALPAGARWAVLRAPAVYGPGDRETLAFFRTVQAGLALLPHGGTGRVSLIHVADLTRAVADMLDRPPPAGVYEIDDGRPGGHALADMNRLAARLLGRTVLPVPTPRALVRMVAATQQFWAQMTGRPAILSAGKVAEIFFPDWSVHDRRLAYLLDFRAEFDLEAGFADTIRWYRAQNWL